MPDLPTSRSMAREALVTSDPASATVNVPRDALQSLVNTPDQDTANHLWRWLVPGLLILSGISLAGMIWLIADGNAETTPDLVLTAFSSTLTGLLGLFIKAPQP